MYNTNLVSIEKENVMMKFLNTDETKKIKNDLVYIFAGGEMPTSFLENAGVEITKRFGHVMKKYK